jgi:hypothetical protein
MQIATSRDLLSWSILPSPVMDKRACNATSPLRRVSDDTPSSASCAFDSYVIEPGPPPVRLSDGNWLFVYNGTPCVCRKTRRNKIPTRILKANYLPQLTCNHNSPAGARECPTPKPNYRRCYGIGWAVMSSTVPGATDPKLQTPNPFIPDTRLKPLQLQALFSPAATPKHP